MEKNNKVLVLRYGVNILMDCIDRHIDTLKEKGYCWFGKIGRAPSTKVLNTVLDNGKGTIILYSRAGIYLCIANEISCDKPKTAFPQYYEELIWNKGIEPSLYFKLSSIERIEPAFLTQYTVCSSGNILPQTLNKSMNSFFVVESAKKNALDLKEKKDNTVQVNNQVLDINDCIYRKEEKCTRKGFVSYQFECTRPSNCVGQKR